MQEKSTYAPARSNCSPETCIRRTPSKRAHRSSAPRGTRCETPKRTQASCKRKKRNINSAARKSDRGIRRRVPNARGTGSHACEQPSRHRVKAATQKLCSALIPANVLSKPERHPASTASSAGISS